MNFFLAACVVLAVPAVLCYDEKYDHIDVDKILSDDTLFDAYLNCLLDKGPCEAENSKEFRELIPEVIALACEKCSPIQKKHVKKTVQAIQEKRPKQFEEFQQKYDPKGEYEANFAEFLIKTQ